MARMGTNEAREVLHAVIDTAHRHPASRAMGNLAGQAGTLLAMIASGFGFDRADVDYLRTEASAVVWGEALFAEAAAA